MFTLAATNMILRGDGSSNIRKGNTFRTPEELYTNFKANRILLNPPFTFEEKGMPFIEFGLNKMGKGGLGAIIIQDSAGSGEAVNSNQKILKNYTLLASIKMPADLFIPMAGVQTSIYIFQSGVRHDYDKTVKFIDFRNDGYKRTKRGLREIDKPTQRYQDIISIYKAGKNAKVDRELWDLDEIYIEDFINHTGSDWNYEQHKIIDTTPTVDDFKETVSDYLKWEVSKILEREESQSKKILSSRLERLEYEFQQNGGTWKEYHLDELFEKRTIKGFPKSAENLIENKDGYHVFGQNIKYQYPQKVKLDDKYLQEVDPHKPILAYTSSAAEIGIIEESFYRSGDNGAFQRLFPKFKDYNKRHLLYILGCLSKQFKNFGYSTGMSNIMSLMIELPLKDGEINFSYMEKFIEELEALRIEELEALHIEELDAYLRVTGIKEYDLTDEDKKVIDTNKKSS